MTASSTYKDLEELIPQKCWIFKWAKRRSQYWYCRIYTGERKYSHRSLKTEDLKIAKEKAYEVFAEVITQVKTTVLHLLKPSATCAKDGSRGKRTEMPEATFQRLSTELIDSYSLFMFHTMQNTKVGNW